MGLFDLFKNKNKDHCQSYLKELIRVAKADGTLEKSEYDFILKIAAKLECNPDEVADLSKAIEVESQTETTSKGQRLKLLFDLVLIMMIDGHIDSQEMDLCYSIAIKSGFDPRTIKDIVYRIQQKREQGIELEEATEQIYLEFSKA